MADQNEERNEVAELIEKYAGQSIGKERQIDIAAELQGLLLLAYKAKLIAGTINGTEMAALQRLLSDNGWSLDPSKIPQELKGMLTTEVDPDDLDDDDPDVIALQSRRLGT